MSDAERENVIRMTNDHGPGITRGALKLADLVREYGGMLETLSTTGHLGATVPQEMLKLAQNRLVQTLDQVATDLPIEKSAMIASARALAAGARKYWGMEPEGDQS